jgi:CRP-like cAMP-binding protein
MAVSYLGGRIIGDARKGRRSSQPTATLPLSGNHLLDALPKNERESLIQDAEERALRAGDVLYEPARRIGTVFFPTTAVVSVCILSEEGTWLGTAITGSQGFVGLPVFLGPAMTPNRMASVLLSGEALALTADTFLGHVEASPKLTELLGRYTAAFITQVAQAVLCEHEHKVESRVARWLLTLHDQIRGDRLSLTQETLSRMVGARRSSVSEAVGSLAHQGAIRRSRGHIDVVDGSRLEKSACRCYDVIRQEVARVLPLA